MKPAPPETAEILHRVRQQVLLAQARIMELEDARDELAAKLAGVEKLLAAIQSLADGKTGEAGHLAKTLAEMQGHYENLRHAQHVTNEALEETRRQLAQAREQITAAQDQTTRLQQSIDSLGEKNSTLAATIDRLSRELAESQAASAGRLARLTELDHELHAMKASRSWRWTRWLRSIERTFGPRKS